MYSIFVAFEEGNRLIYFLPRRLPDSSKVTYVRYIFMLVIFSRRHCAFIHRLAFQKTSASFYFCFFA